MTTTNYYCAGEQCRKSTTRLMVRLQRRTYLYCVRCGRRLEMRDEYECERDRTPARD